MVGSNWLLVSYEPEKEQALFEWALQQCKDHDIHLNILVVLPDLSYEVFKWFEMHDYRGIQQQQTERETQKRQAWIGLAKEEGVSFSLKIKFGRLFYESIVYAMQRKAELVVKLADDMHDQQGFLFKSDDWHLLRKSPFPLLLYRNSSNLPFNQVMASIDVNVEVQPYQPSLLNQTLLSWAEHLHPDCSLNVVHAWQAQMENLVRHWDTDLTERQLIELSEHLYLHHKKALAVELESFGVNVSDCRLYLCKGEPVEAIAQVIENNEVDLLILGTLARGGVPGLLIGNTAEELLERVNCSVLAIKPQNFESPITLD